MRADQPHDLAHLEIMAPTIRTLLMPGVRSTLWALLGFLSVVSWNDVFIPSVQLLMVGVVPFLAIAVRASLRCRKDLPSSIHLHADHILLPAHLLSSQAIHILLDGIRSMAVDRRISGDVLIIGTRWRNLAIPLSRLTDAAAVEGFSVALRVAILARPGGAARWAAIEERSALAKEISQRDIKGSLSVIAVFGIAATLQMLFLRRGDPTELLYFGALVPELVSQGEWFRLVTANLLHTAPHHALAEGILLWFAGTVAERVLGTRWMLLVLLVTALVAQAAAVFDGASPSQLFTIGLSGGVLGLCGALFIAIWKFRNSLPVSIQLNSFNIVVIILGVAGICRFVGAVDAGSVLAGGVAGFCLGLLSCHGRTDVRSYRHTGTTIRLTSDLAIATWALGIGIGVLHLSWLQSRSKDQSILVASMLTNDKVSDRLMHELARQVAVNPEASSDLLKGAGELAARAAARSTRADPKNPQNAQYADTLAILDFRRGDPALAMRREFAWINSAPSVWPHFTVFLDRTAREHGIQIFGQTGPVAPTITLGQGLIQLTVSEAALNGARVYAILRNHDRAIGTLVFQIPANYVGHQILPQPWANGSPSTVAPPSFWSDPATEVEVALFDRRSCFCRYPVIGPTYVALPEESDLPPWKPPGLSLASAP